MATWLAIPARVIMNILYVGDVMGEPGMKVLADVLPSLKQDHAVDVIVVQAENVTQGRGLSLVDFKRLKDLGVDFCSGGNWTLYRNELSASLSDPASPVIRPANYPPDVPGIRWKVLQTELGPVAMVSLLGKIVGRDADKPIDNPLKVIDEILDEINQHGISTIVVNFHGDYSSEKRIIGYYLDGRASLVVGDHWHIPTADAMVLPQGTAHITDVGMCGTLHSSLGVKFSSTIPRWRDGLQTRNELETEGPLQFNAVLATIDASGRATKIEQIQRIV